MAGHSKPGAVHLDIPQRQRLPDIHHHREANDLGASLEEAENAGVRHGAEQPALPLSRQPDFPLTVPLGKFQCENRSHKINVIWRNQLKSINIFDL